MLFVLYLNDLENEFMKKGTASTDLQLLSLYLLMHADDMVLFSESIDELQSMLNTLQLYTSEWNLDVNVSKTKVVIFRNGGNNRTNEKWLYNGENLEIVDQFIYLGVVFNYNGKFFITQKQLATQGRKAMFALKSTINQLYLNHCTFCFLFLILTCVAF